MFFYLQASAKTERTNGI